MDIVGTWMVVGLVVAIVAVLAYRWGASDPKPTKEQSRSVDRYVIAMSEGDFPQILLSLQLDSGETHGPFAFVPAFAFALSDEMTIAAARAAPKRSNRALAYSAIEEITDDAPEYANGGPHHG